MQLPAWCIQYACYFCLQKRTIFLPMLFITWTNLIVLSELSFNVIHSLLILLSCLCADYLLLIVYVTYVLTSGSWILLSLVRSLLIVTCIQRKMNLFASSGLFSLVMLSCSLILVLVELLTVSVSLKQFCFSSMLLLNEKKSQFCLSK